MRKGVLAEDAEASRGMAVSRDEIRAFLTFCLAASLLAVYAYVWATSLSS
jgi:hypothetical protein